MKIKIDDITTLIPQRAPFIMIDNLISANETGFDSAFEIKSDNIFINIEDNTISESAIVENIAQTCAAGFGYLNSLKSDAEPRLGFIGAITKLTNHQKARLGDSLITKISILNTFENIHLIQGKCFKNDELLIECQMKIVLA